MKKIKFTCPICQAKLRVPTHLVGVTAPCPKCGAEITAPTDFENLIEEEPVPGALAAPTQQVVQGTVPDSASPAAQAEIDHANEETVVDSELVNELTGVPSSETDAVLPEPTMPPLGNIADSFKSDGLPPEPPAVAKTQPIKINPRPDALLSSSKAEDSGSGDLPSLDTSLVSTGENAAGTLTRENEPEPTKLVLPMSGEIGEQVTPNDFLQPKSASGEGLEEISKQLDDLTDDNFQQTTEEAKSIKETGLSETLTKDGPVSKPEAQADILDSTGEVAAFTGESEEGPRTDGTEPAISMDDLPVSDEEPSISIDELDAIEPLNRDRTGVRIVDETLEANFGLLDQELRACLAMCCTQSSDRPGVSLT